MAGSNLLLPMAPPAQPSAAGAPPRVTRARAKQRDAEEIGVEGPADAPPGEGAPTGALGSGSATPPAAPAAPERPQAPAPGLQPTPAPAAATGPRGDAEAREALHLGGPDGGTPGAPDPGGPPEAAPVAGAPLPASMGKAAVTAERGPSATHPESSEAGQADRRLSLLELEFGSLKQHQQEQTALMSDLLAAVQAMGKPTDELRSEPRQPTAGAPAPEAPIVRDSSFITPHRRLPLSSFREHTIPSPTTTVTTMRPLSSFRARTTTSMPPLSSIRERTTTSARPITASWPRQARRTSTSFRSAPTRTMSSRPSRRSCTVGKAEAPIRASRRLRALRQRRTRLRRPSPPTLASQGRTSRGGICSSTRCCPGAT